MPSLSLYLDPSDAQLVAEHLTEDEEIAEIVSDGDRRWIARCGVEAVSDGRHCLWHVPSGPLPLVMQRGVENPVVPDPWQGWAEVRAGANPAVPYFGPGHPGIIWWNERVQRKGNEEGIGFSSFEWIGNRYRILGNPADKVTEQWWQRLRRWIAKTSVQRIPRSGPIEGEHPDVWAFPGAHSRISGGAPRDANP